MAGVVHLKRLLRHDGAGYRVILTNASSLVGTTAITSILGGIFWLVAARQFPPAAVGLGAAMVSAMTLLGTMGVLGFGTLLIGEFPRRRGQEGGLIAAALIVTGLTGTALGIGFAIAAPRVSAHLAPLAKDPARVALFAFGVGLAAVTLVLDQALIGLLRGELQLWRNTVFAFIKLVALVTIGGLAVSSSEMAIYIAWVIGGLASLLFLLGRAAVKHQAIRHHRPQWRLLRGLGRPALAHHGLNLALQVPSAALPVVVTVLLSAQANAYFYAAWMLANFIFVGPSALTSVLYAAGAAAPATLAQKIRFTLVLAVIIGLLSNLALLAGAGVVLKFAGGAYAEKAELPLRLLALGVFPLIVKNHYVTICRIQYRILPAARLAAIGSVLELGLGSGGAIVAGLPGLCVGWLIAVGIEAVLMAGLVYHVARPISGSLRQQLSRVTKPLRGT